MRARISTIAIAVTFAWLAQPGGRASAGPPQPTLEELGRQLVIELGCPGCHTMADAALRGLGKPGPDLRRIAAKTHRRWAFEWIMAPRKLLASTKMPHFLEPAQQAEAQSIVAYLWASSEDVEYPPPPAGDAVRGEHLFASVGCSGCHLRQVGVERAEAPIDRLHGPNLAALGGKVDPGWLFAWLKDPKRYSPETPMPDLRLGDREAADLTAFLIADRVPETGDRDSTAFGGDDIEAGREGIELYGCYGCHRIAGFEDAGRHAGELDSATGFTGHGISGLPDFRLSAGEAEALRTAIDSPAAGVDPALAEGRELVTRYGCRGCHLVEGRGHAVADTIDDPGLLPPNLDGEGARVQPAWLHAYLADPGSVRLRSWLTVRMPSFDFSEAQMRALVAYFEALETEKLAPRPIAPLTAPSIALGREVFDLMPCGSCHPKDARAAAGLALDAASLGPPLGLARRRLRYQWIGRWIEDPQSWQPGTRMPTFFLPTQSGVLSSPFAGAIGSPFLAEPKARLREHFGSERQIDALLLDADAVIAAMRDYVWSLAETGE